MDQIRACSINLVLSEALTETGRFHRRSLLAGVGHR